MGGDSNISTDVIATTNSNSHVHPVIVFTWKFAWTFTKWCIIAAACSHSSTRTLPNLVSPTVLQQQVHLPSQSISRQCTSHPTTLQFGQSLICPPIPQPMIPNALNFRTPTCNQTSQRRPQIQPKASFPTPNEGEFHIYLLQFCPSQTSMCFGCGNPIRKKDVAVVIPNDLVIVSKMLREWSYQGTAQGKIANVYFHCKEECVQKKQASFNGGMCSIPPQIQPHLHELHKAHLRASLRM
jgi:hypothetical protein